MQSNMEKILNPNSTLSISILSGKGGVGKSNIALNLGYALNKSGNRVLLVDCDLGLANLDILIGLTPQANIKSMLDDNIPPEEIILPITGHGLDLLPANTGIIEGTADQNSISSIFTERLSPFVLKYDYVLLDIGAGISSAALSFGAMAMLRCVVITPEPTSLTDSYALIKVMSARKHLRDYFVLVNQIGSKKEETVSFNRLTGVCKHFLNITPSLLGAIREDAQLVEAVRHQKIALEMFPQSKAAKDINAIAKKIETMRSAMAQRIINVPVLKKDLLA